MYSRHWVPVSIRKYYATFWEVKTLPVNQYITPKHISKLINNVLRNAKQEQFKYS